MKRASWLAFATSAAGLLLQCVQTRVYSVVLWNHFVYFIVSVALLGYGVSGTWLALGRSGRLARLLSVRAAGALFVVGALVSTLVLPIHATEIQGTSAGRLFATLGVYLVAVVPYFACGWILGVVFRDEREHMNALYFADLCGAAVGCILFVLLISPLGVVHLVNVACALVGAATLAASEGRETNRLGAFLLAALLGPLVVLAPRIEAAIRPGPDKMETTWSRDVPAGTTAIVEQSEWNTLSRIDIVARGLASPIRGIFIDGDAWTSTLADFANVHRRGPEGTAWPFVLDGSPKRGLVIGAGGGYEVYQQLCAGVEHLDAVEINPTTYRCMREVYKDFNGGLFTRPEVVYTNEDGRSFIRRSRDSYDIIMMQGVDTFTALDSRAYVLSESYLYTVEAISDYVRHLAPRGRLYIGRANTKPESMRLFVTALEGLRRAGVASPEKCIMVHEWGVWMAILAQREPFTAADFARLDARPFWVTGTRLDYPAKGAVLRPEFADYVTALGQGRGPTYLATLPYDATPVTDDSPFFFHYERWSALPAAIARGDLGDAIRGNWPTLTMGAMLVMTTLLVGVFMVLPLWLRGRATTAKPLEARPAWRGYFVCLGVAFIFIELALMQRFALLLGHPSRSLVLVLGVLLLSAGIGSALADRFVARFGVPFVPIVVLSLLAAFGYPLVADATLHLPLAARGVVAAALVTPLGLLLGMPFPLGLRKLGQASEEDIPWMWGVNGGATVLGSILATMIAMATNFTVVLTLAAVGYAIAGLLWRRATRAG